MKYTNKKVTRYDDGNYSLTFGLIDLQTEGSKKLEEIKLPDMTDEEFEYYLANPNEIKNMGIIKSTLERKKA